MLPPRRQKELPTQPDRRSPQRTCVGCRVVHPSSMMVRFVLASSGVQCSRTAAGRGAWLCSPSCIDLAIRRNGFQRAWRVEVPLDSPERLRMAFAEFAATMEESTVADGPRKG